MTFLNIPMWKILTEWSLMQSIETNMLSVVDEILLTWIASFSVSPHAITLITTRVQTSKQTQCCSVQEGQERDSLICWRTAESFPHELQQVHADPWFHYRLISPPALIMQTLFTDAHIWSSAAAAALAGNHTALEHVIRSAVIQCGWSLWNGDWGKWGFKKSL